VAVLVGVGLAVSTLPSNAPGYSGWAYGLAGGVAALVFLAAVLVHELGHAVVARRQGLTVDGITLWLLGGVTRIEGEARTPASEFRISGAGPLVSFLLGLGLGALGLVFGALSWSPLVAAALGWLGVINLVLAVFNVLPGAPLDGGRLLHALLWRRHGDRLRATETVSRSGWVLGLGLVVLGLVGSVFTGLGGLWLALVGWFLMSASRAERGQARLRYALEDLRAADIMTTDPVHGPGWLTVQAFVDDYVRGYSPGAFPVESWQGELSGLATLEQLRSVPPGQRGYRRVADVAWPLSRVPVVDPQQSAVDVARLMAQGPSRRALVMDGDRLVGIIAPSDLNRALDRSRLRRPRLVGI
jgi:Zn-dependent protease